ncbi:hypothetical protein G5645_07415 [Pectobacterium carotovorum]|uniref:hypothetical protein n=1 Tax=Pectobacterium carotovorum TaxID=554 RepID=UPI00191D301D|nr:hypothetical protein [Pectobacterium carotovorum]MBL0907823.1 hypothetical protein [Pectobacterium carotovorum]
MKVIIQDDDGKVVYEHHHSANYNYNQEGQQLFAAVLAEAAWRAHNPLFDVKPQACGFISNLQR